jgi:hypothetical protein
MADVFMSYSRRDREAVVRIVEALRARGKTVWVDLDDILPSSKWMAQIGIAIAGSDTVIVAISPDSVISHVCQEEVSIALGLPKRVVPIVVRETPMHTVPPSVAELSFLLFTPVPGETALDEEGFQAAVERLVEVLDTDIEAVHTHSEILRKAMRWEQRGEDRSQLLRGKELEEAEQWQVAQSARKPASSDGVHVLFCPYCGTFADVLRLARQRVVRLLTPEEEAEFLHEKEKVPPFSPSLVQAPVISEAVAPVPVRVGTRIPGTPSDQLRSQVPFKLSGSCRVEPNPGFSAEALVDCGADGPARLPSRTHLNELNYLLYPSAAALDQAYRAFLAQVARRPMTGHFCADRSLGHHSLGLVAGGECSYRFPGGPVGRVVEFYRTGEKGSPPDIAWTVQQPGEPPMLIDATGAPGANNAALIAAWWAAGPSNWLEAAP